MFPQLEVLDGVDKEGAEVLSEEDDDEEYDQEYDEEEELEGEFGNEGSLDPEL